MEVCLALRNFNLVSKFQLPRGALKYRKIYVHNLDQIHKFLLLAGSFATHCSFIMRCI